nr:glutaredoxin domain-containing protein [uncultured Roseateles sp.]
MVAVPANAGPPDLRVYWQPGCSSCLRLKEYLEARGLPYVSRNVLADPQAYAELQHLGLRRVPIITRGGRYADGQVLADVARLVGLDTPGLSLLPPAELLRRLRIGLATAQAGLRQFDEGQLAASLPDRPRTWGELAFHIFNVADAWVELGEGTVLTYAAYNRLPLPGRGGRDDLLDYAVRVQARVANRWLLHGDAVDWQARADVYYGVQTQHQFLERTAWHCLQHTRQLLSLPTAGGMRSTMQLDQGLLDGLPMPLKVWD